MPDLLGAKLRHLRNQHQLTQAALAKELGLSSHAHLSYLERGQREPSLSLLIRLALRFGASVDYLLRDEFSTDAVQPLALTQRTAQAVGGLALMGRKLRYLREQQELTQAELAEKVATITQGYVSLLEANQYEASVDIIIRLANVLGTSIDYLIFDDIPINSDEYD